MQDPKSSCLPGSAAAGTRDAPGSAASVAGRYPSHPAGLPPRNAPGPRIPVPAARRVTPRPPTSARRAPPRLARPGPALAEDARPGGRDRGGGRAAQVRRSPRGPPTRRHNAGRDREVRLRLQQAPRSCPAPNTVINAAASGFMAKAPALHPLPPPPPPRAEVPVTRHSTPGLGGEEPRLHSASRSGRVRPRPRSSWGKYGGLQVEAAIFEDRAEAGARHIGPSSPDYTPIPFP